MAVGTAEYTPPSGREISDRQNGRDALRLLLAQRKLYSQSKRWLGLRWLGMLVIALAAPPIAVIWPNLAVAAGAVAGGWIFIGRTALFQLEQKTVERAASVQERFDFTVFGMPATGIRSALPSLEDIASLAGPDGKIADRARKGKLNDWYPIDVNQSGLKTVAICQRANVSYSDRLLNMTARIWVVTLSIWVVALIVASIALKVSLSAFLLGAMMPLLPAFLDVWEYWRNIRRAAKDRRDLATTIETSLSNTSPPVDSQDLLVWQERIFDLRRNAPQVPDFIYKVTRKRNEAAMHTAADQLNQG